MRLEVWNVERVNGGISTSDDPGPGFGFFDVVKKSDYDELKQKLEHSNPDTCLCPYCIKQKQVNTLEQQLAEKDENLNRSEFFRKQLSDLNFQFRQDLTTANQRLGEITEAIDDCLIHLELFNSSKDNKRVDHVDSILRDLKKSLELKGDSDGIDSSK